MNLLIKNARCIDPSRGLDETADILLMGGIIEKIGRRLTAPAGCPVLDLAGAIAAPGFIDMHVHLREPGFEYKETIASGCRAAAAGGFTAVCPMPNTEPAADDASVVRQIIERGRSASGIVDLHPVAAVTVGRRGEHLAPMLELAEAGAVAFSDDGAPVRDAEVMRRALEYAAMTGKPLIQHAEETALTKGGAMNEGRVSAALGMPPMPPEAEEIVVARDIALAAAARPARYHVAHISTAAAAGHVARAKASKLPVTCEVTPHHFTLTDEAVRSFDTNTKMNPPLRTADDVQAMKEGLRDGTIDAIATDHAPHSFDDKEVEFAAAPFGIIGLETAIGLAVHELVGGKFLTLYQLVEKFSTNPRSILGLPAASIEEGGEANLTLLDPTVTWRVDPGKFHSLSKNTPFGGAQLTGRAIGIINHGKMARNGS